MRSAAVLAVFVVSLAFAQQSPAPEPSHDKPAEAVYKNIKSLNGVPSDELIPSMQYFGAALGVGCDHCHVLDQNKRDFPSDEKKPKQVARQMITMMKQINQTNFKGEQEVTCATCHNGHANPSRTAPVATLESISARANRPAPVDRASLPPAEQLFQAFTNAVGGQPAIDKLKTRRATGQIDTGRGQPWTFDETAAAPDKMLLKVDLGQGRAHEEAFDGTTAWTQDGPRVGPARGAEASFLKLAANFYSDLDLAKQFPRAQTRGKDKVNDKDAWVVRASRGEGQPSETLYFDPDTKLLLRRVVLVPTPFGPFNQQIDYSDWRDVNGVKLPFTQRISRPESIATRKYTKVEFNVPVDDKAFAKPPAPPAGAAFPGH